MKRTFDELPCRLEEENVAASLKATRIAIVPHQAADVHSLTHSLTQAFLLDVREALGDAFFSVQLFH